MPPKRQSSNPQRAILQLKLADIAPIPEVQSRLQLDAAAVARYAEYYTDEPDNDRVLPPITVRVHQGSYVLGDGFHRLEAAKQAGRTYLLAYVEPGDLHDAWWDGVKANGAGPVKYTGPDLRSILYRIFAHPTDTRLSDRTIAKLVGCSHVYVSRLRGEHQQAVNQESVNKLTPHEIKALAETKQIEQRHRARQKAQTQVHEGLTTLLGLIEAEAQRTTLAPYIAAAQEAVARLEAALELSTADNPRDDD